MSNPHLIITSIASAEHPVLRHFASACTAQNWGFTVVGDTKSPEKFDLDGCRFLGVEEQKSLPFKLASLLPFKHYARKNLGYLEAIRQGARILVETDDDNWPLEGFWQERVNPLPARPCDHEGWVNVYRHFTTENIWPRGLALESLQEAPATYGEMRPVRSPIQQGLADRNPDVDAIYRLTLPLPLDFDPGAEPVALGEGAFCPFNSQNTTWFPEAFPLMYLPSYCSFRMTDIWRSFVAQRVAWTCGWSVHFHTSTVWQERNDHNLMKDFSDEISGYQNNNLIYTTLCALPLKTGVSHICENLLACYEALVELKLVGAHELALVQAWITDVQALQIAESAG